MYELSKHERPPYLSLQDLMKAMGSHHAVFIDVSYDPFRTPCIDMLIY